MPRGRLAAAIGFGGQSCACVGPTSARIAAVWGCFFPPAQSVSATESTQPEKNSGTIPAGAAGGRAPAPRLAVPPGLGFGHLLRGPLKFPLESTAGHPHRRLPLGRADPQPRQHGRRLVQHLPRAFGPLPPNQKSRVCPAGREQFTTSTRLVARRKRIANCQFMVRPRRANGCPLAAKNLESPGLTHPTIRDSRYSSNVRRK